MCRPSSRDISSLENVSPGIRPRFFSQKMAQKLQRRSESIAACSCGHVQCSVSRSMRSGSGVVASTALPSGRGCKERLYASADEAPKLSSGMWQRQEERGRMPTLRQQTAALLRSSSFSSVAFRSA